MKLTVAFRVDASKDIGTGHVMRCLTLADALGERGAKPVFICRAHIGNLIDLIKERGYEVKVLQSSNSESPPLLEGRSYDSWLGCDWSSDAIMTQSVLEGVVDWLIVDHYSLDQKWENLLRSNCRHLMVIDDLADRRHDCDLLLDQNLGRSLNDYVGLVPMSAKTLLGPNFALLRPEFSQMRACNLKQRIHPRFKRLLITMGGMDKDNATGKVLDVLKSSTALPYDVEINIVLGSRAPHLEKIFKQVKTLPYSTKVLVDVKNMAQLMTESDLVIGAAGCTALEFCCLGLPALILVLAENQKAGAEALKRNGAAIVLDSYKLIPKIINNLDNSCLLELNRKASEVVDGLGVSRVLSHIYKKNLVLRKVTIEDEILLFYWVNEGVTRNNAVNPSPISLASHKVWLSQRLADGGRTQMYILEEKGKPVGQVRFDRKPQGEWEISYSIETFNRGRGLGRLIIDYGVSALNLVNTNSLTIVAKVKQSNLASCRIFESLDFIKKHTEGDFIYYEKRTN